MTTFYISRWECTGMIYDLVNICRFTTSKSFLIKLLLSLIPNLFHMQISMCFLHCRLMFFIEYLHHTVYRYISNSEIIIILFEYSCCVEEMFLCFFLFFMFSMFSFADSHISRWWCALLIFSSFVYNVAVLNTLLLLVHFCVGLVVNYSVFFKAPFPDQFNLKVKSISVIFVYSFTSCEVVTVYVSEIF